MQIGVVFPQTEIGPDPAGVRAYAQAVQQVGFKHLLRTGYLLLLRLLLMNPWPMSPAITYTARIAARV
jgi:hypothetical protein